MPNSDNNTATKQSALIWLWITVAVVALDLITKHMAELWLVYNQPVYILPFLNITLHYNDGAGFSFLSGQRWLLVFISSAMSVVLFFWLKGLTRKPILQPLYVSLILGGALGNLHDRLMYGKVVDFISVHWQSSYYFPTFNVADMAISLAAMLMIYDVFIHQAKNKPKGSE